MEFEIVAENKTVKFYTAKNFVVMTGILNKENTDIKKGLKILFPNKINLENEKNVSLTDSFNYQEQIRFFLKERVIRSFIKLGKEISLLENVIILNIYNSNNLDEGSALFFQTITEKFENIHVKFHTAKKNSLIKRYYEDEYENQLEILFSKLEKPTLQELAYVKKQAQTYINCGDSWTAEVLLKFIVKHIKNSEIYNMLGLTYMLQHRTFEAEYFYNLWRENGGDFDRAAADYALSMLYIRHHPQEFTSLEKAEYYLQDGLEYLNKVDSNSIKDLDFEKVFNRNGYALVLFRKGDIDGAINLLVKGIAKLEETENKTSYLHRTVLIYNLAQCYKAKGDIDNAILTYKKLLALDEYFPEYHMEIAKCYMDRDEFKEAIKHLKLAKNLDDSIIEIYLLIGYSLKELGDLKNSLEYYKIAYQLNSRNVQVAYDYAYILSENSMFSEAINILETIELNLLEENMVADIFSLKAEIHSILYDTKVGLKIIKAGLALIPHNKQLIDNANLLESSYIEA